MRFEPRGLIFRSVRATIGGFAVVVVAACADLGAPSAVPPDGPNLVLVPYDTAAAGAKLAEVFLQVPASGAWVDTVSFFSLGTFTDSAIVEGFSMIQADNGHAYPFNLIAGAARIHYYRANGDLWYRDVHVEFLETLAGGGKQIEDLFASTPTGANPLRFRDTDAALHGMEVILTVGQATPAGQNANNPGFVQPCAWFLLGSGLCVPGPGFSPDFTYTADPAGQLRLRAYKLARDTFDVACLPAAPAHGSTVTCSATLSTGQAYTIVERRSMVDRGPDTVLAVSSTSAIPIAAGQVYTWTGPAVATTQIMMRAQVGSGSTITNYVDSSTFVVARRSYPPLALGVPPVWVTQVRNSNPTDMTTPPKPVRSSQGGYATTYGRWVNRIPNISDSALRTRLGSVTSGPDSSLVYTSGPSSVPGGDSAYIHPALYGPPLATGANLSWYTDQNAQGGGSCDQVAIQGTLLPFTERHEGVTLAPNSHPGRYNASLASYRLQDSLEMLVTRAFDTAAASLRASFLWNDWYVQFAAANAQFELSERTILFGVGGLLACQIDYNPNDP